MIFTSIGINAPEPSGGAHTDPMAATELLKGALKKNLLELKRYRQRRKSCSAAIVRNIARFYTKA
jgi:acetyl-CoA carboxylase alpha subunit